MKKSFSYEKLIRDYSKYLERSSSEDNIESFKTYLGLQGYDTTHAQAIYKALETGAPIEFDEDFSLEKTGRGSRYGKRIIAFLASFVGSFAITMPLVAIATSIATIAGGSALGIEIMGDFWKTLINPALVGVATGGVVATGYSLSKIDRKKKNSQPFNYMTKGFRLTYGNEKELIAEYAKRLTIDGEFNIVNPDKVSGTKFDKLLNNIQRFCEESLANPKKAKKIFNVGRDRIHYLEFVTRQLLDEFYLIYGKGIDALTDDDVKRLIVINDMLQREAGVITKISEDSKANALLVGEHGDEKHAHIIKNLDILANLNNYHNAVCEELDITKQITKKTLKSFRKDFHKEYKYDPIAKKESAEELLNKPKDIYKEEDSIIGRILDARRKKPTPEPTPEPIPEPIPEPTPEPKPKTTSGTRTSYKLPGQTTILEYIETNLDAQDRLLDFISNKFSKSREEAIGIANSFIKILGSRNRKGRVLQSDKNLPEVKDILTFLTEDYKIHGKDTIHSI